MASRDTAEDGAQRTLLIARDGFRLGATLIEPEKGQKGALGTVIVHGATAVPSGYYRRFAAFLARSGLRVLTYDYRGIGLSRRGGLRGFHATMSDWAQLDARAAHDFVQRRFPEQPVVTVGHSFGGQLIGLLDAAREVRGSVLVGSQLAYVGHFGPLARLRLGLLLRAVLPALTAGFGYLPGRAGLGHDLPKGVAEEWARWCLSRGYLVTHHPDARARFSRFDQPVLLYSFSDDAFAPRRAVEALVSSLTAAQLVERRIEPRDFGGAAIGHFGFFKPRFESTLWQEAADFLVDLVSARVRAREVAGGHGRA